MPRRVPDVQSSALSENLGGLAGSAILLRVHMLNGYLPDWHLVRAGGHSEAA